MKRFLITCILAYPSFLVADTAILVALPSEQAALRLEIRLVGQSIDIAGPKVAVGYRKGEKLFLAKTGAGNLNSAMVTEGLICSVEKLLDVS
ncbi:MAG: hypothetical protein ACREVT_06690 [Burkholderiales bacterium]